MNIYILMHMLHIRINYCGINYNTGTLELTLLGISLEREREKGHLRLFPKSKSPKGLEYKEGYHEPVFLPSFSHFVI